MGENDVIFGGEKKLYKAIKHVKENYSPEAIFVYSTCVTALIGEDIDAVCKAAEKKVEVEQKVAAEKVAKAAAADQAAANLAAKAAKELKAKEDEIR